MTYEVKRFDLLSVFKISFLIYLVIGFMVGILYALVLLKMMAAFGPLLEGEMFRDVGQLGMVGALGLSLFMAFIMAIIWSIITVIAAGVYNVLAGFIGGLRLELDEISQGYFEPRPSAPQVNPPSQGGIPSE